MAGVNPIDDIANDVFEPEKFNATGVGAWNTGPMIRRVFPTGNYYNQSIDLTCDATNKDCLPTVIADEYYVNLAGLNGLIDYYVVATDNVGNVKNSAIYHVFVNGTSTEL